jgi:hypothetical protein
MLESMLEPEAERTAQASDAAKRIMARVEVDEDSDVARNDLDGRDHGECAPRRSPCDRVG